MKKIKVLNVIYGFNTGGAETVAYNILRHFKDDPDIDLKTVSILGYQGRLLEKKMREESLSVIYPEKDYADHFPRLVKHFSKFLIFSKQRYYYQHVKREIEKLNPDVIHVHMSLTMQMAYAAIIKNNSARRLYTMHSMPETEKMHNRRLISRLIDKENFYPICVTEAQAMSAQKLYNMKSLYSIVRNGIDITRFNPATEAEKTELRQKYGIEKDAYVIGFVGRLHKIKNLSFLLQVFERIHAVNDTARLLIVGDGPDMSKLQEKAASLHIKNFVYFVGNKDATDYYKMMDIFGLTSFYESSSIVTVEAQLVGLPCVVSDAVSNEADISDNITHLALSEPLSVWADAFLEHKKNTYIDRKKFDVHETMSVLKKIYMRTDDN